MFNKNLKSKLSPPIQAPSFDYPFDKQDKEATPEYELRYSRAYKARHRFRKRLVRFVNQFRKHKSINIIIPFLYLLTFLVYLLFTDNPFNPLTPSSLLSPSPDISSALQGNAKSKSYDDQSASQDNKVFQELNRLKADFDHLEASKAEEKSKLNSMELLNQYRQNRLANPHLSVNANSKSKSLKSFPYTANTMTLPNAPFKHNLETTDIRVTKQIYFSAINDYLVSLNKDSNYNNHKLPEFPFHWKDFIDMNELSPMISEKSSCFIAGIFGATKRTEWEGCIDVDPRNKDDESLITENSLNFYFDSPATKHANADRLRLRAKIYNYMKAPLPSKLVFTIGDFIFVSKVTTSSNSKERFSMDMANSGLLDDYIKSQLRESPSSNSADILVKPLETLDILNSMSKSLGKDLLNIPMNGEELDEESDSSSQMKIKEVELSQELFEFPKDFKKSKIAKEAKRKGLNHFHDVMLINDDNRLSTESYDWRFFKAHITSDFDRKSYFHQLSRAWLDLCSNLGLNTWLSQETLLGWSRNGMLSPWEKSMHYELPAQDLIRIAEQFNNSLVLSDPRDGSGMYYIDVSPHYMERARENSGDLSPDTADMRFIDIRNGLYLEINGLIASQTGLGIPQNYLDSFGDDFIIKKDIVDNNKVNNDPEHKFINSGIGSFYHLSQLNPLKRTLFEGKIANVPQDSYLLLNYMYSSVVSINKINGYRYIPHLRLWVDDSKCNYVPQEDIRLFEKGGSNFIGACHDLNIWDEYNKTTAATSFRAWEIEVDNGVDSVDMFGKFGSVNQGLSSSDELPLLYDDVWVRDRQFMLNLVYNIDLSQNLQDLTKKDV